MLYGPFLAHRLDLIYVLLSITTQPMSLCRQSQTTYLELQNRLEKKKKVSLWHGVVNVPQPINVTSPSVSVCLKIMVKWPSALQTSTDHYTTLTAYISQMIRLHHVANVNRLSPAGSLICVKLMCRH